MSASPMARQVTENKAIPTKRVLINDPSELPSHYSSTPGGTLFSTTPGGTKIVYEKMFLMNLRNSPISKTPPSYNIPDALSLKNNTKGGSPTNNHSYSSKVCNNVKKGPSAKLKNNNKSHNIRTQNHDEDQFQIEL